MPATNHLPAPHHVQLELGGRTLILETGKIARQANGAIVARYGDTVLTDLRPQFSIMGFDVSPDGAEILFDRVREDSDLVLIERPK